VEHPPAPAELRPDPVEPPPPPPPPSPLAAPLHTMQAAAPASPMDVEEDTAVAVAALAEDAAVAGAALAEDKQLAARHRVGAALLALARDIRRPRTLLGYSAFVLFGLCKKCRPCAWEGDTLLTCWTFLHLGPCRVAPSHVLSQPSHAPSSGNPEAPLNVFPFPKKRHLTERVIGSLGCLFLLRQTVRARSLSRSTMRGWGSPRCRPSATGIAERM
jgi:hypothetical protein